MKKINILLLLLALVALSGCSIIGGIFKAGAITAIIGIIILVGIIFWIISLFSGKQ